MEVVVQGPRLPEGYRGIPGLDDDRDLFWDPAKPPCVPSRHWPEEHLFYCYEAAEAVAFCELAERNEPSGLPEDEEEDACNAEYYDIACVKHKHALRRLHERFPELECPVQAHASQYPTRPCPCGHGKLAKWPWVVQTARLGFCDCEMGWWELLCWRGEFNTASAPAKRTPWGLTD